MNRKTPRFDLHQWKFSLLLATLLLLMVLDPMLHELHLGRMVFDVLFCLILPTALFAVSQRRRVFWVVLLLGLASVGTTWSAYGFRVDSRFGYCVIMGRHIASMLFLGYTAALVLREVLEGKSISMDKIAGAFCAYLLIGLAWGTLYSMCCWLAPNSFHINAALLEATDRTISDSMSVFIYYSFVTLTTLGYGDITPLTAPVRTFVWIEAVIGQFYLAVLVGRLVGLHIAQSEKS